MAKPAHGAIQDLRSSAKAAARLRDSTSSPSELKGTSASANRSGQNGRRIASPATACAARDAPSKRATSRRSIAGTTSKACPCRKLDRLPFLEVAGGCWYGSPPA
jgi:hypothetical protein